MASENFTIPTKPTLKYVSYAGDVDLYLRTKDVHPDSMDKETNQIIKNCIESVQACIPARIAFLGKQLTSDTNGLEVYKDADYRQVGAMLIDCASVLSLADDWRVHCEQWESRAKEARHE